MSKLLTLSIATAIALGAAADARATGLATCQSGPESGWQPQAKLQQELESKGWQIRRIKVDGGCYEVYAIDDQGKRVESYFHPVTFEHVLTSTR